MTDTRCEAAAMAWAVLEDPDIPPCDELAEMPHTNGNVTYMLCVDCDEALRLFLRIGKRVIDELDA